MENIIVFYTFVNSITISAIIKLNFLLLICSSITKRSVDINYSRNFSKWPESGNWIVLTPVMQVKIPKKLFTSYLQYYILLASRSIVTFIFSFLRSGVEANAALSSVTQHAMPPELGGKWGTECLTTVFWGCLCLPCYVRDTT